MVPLSHDLESLSFFNTMRTISMILSLEDIELVLPNTITITISYGN